MVRVDGMGGGNPLGKITVNGTASAQTLIEGVRHYGGTFFRTGTAAGALVFVNVTSFPAHRDFEIPRLTVHFLHFAIRQKCYIGMSTDIQHLGRENSDGTIVGGKRFIQLSHLAADAGQLLHHVDLNAHIGKVQECLDSGNSSSNNKYVFDHNWLPLYNRFAILYNAALPL